MLPIKLIGIALIASFSTVALAEDEAGVTPYRPSVSSPAQLPLAGQLELELGLLHSKTDKTKRDSLPYQFKLAFNKEWGVLLGGEAYVSNRDEFGQQKGLGDTSIVIKRAFLLDDTTAWGLEFGGKIPSAKDSIGSGKADYTLNAVFSKDIDKLHVDANLNATRVGLQEADTARTVVGIATSFSLPITDKWQAVAEPSATHQSGKPATAQFLTALAFSPNKNLTLDFGIAKGLNKASQNYSLFAGLVMPIAKLW